MGGYCRYCDRRCFLLRVTRDGRTMLLATCTRGMAHDMKVSGETHDSACNPYTQPRRAAALGALAEQRSCHRHSRPNCGAADCRALRRRLIEASNAEGLDATDPVSAAAARHTRQTWAKHGRPEVAVFWGFGGTDVMAFEETRPLLGRLCTIRAEEVPKRENGMQAGSRVVLTFDTGAELRFGPPRRLVLEVPAVQQAA